MTEERVQCQNVDESTLQAEIDIKCTPDKAYAAWTKPDELVKWFGPRVGAGTLRVDHFDCSVGGRYHVTMLFNDGDEMRISGEYQELDPPKKIVLTWQWSNNPTSSNETLVTVLLAPSASGTLLTLTHARFLTTEARNQHHGWVPVLTRLADVLDD